MRHMRTGVMTREETGAQVEMLVRHWEEHGCGLWAVEEKTSGLFIGRIGLMYRDDWPEGGREVGVVDAGWLVDRSLWGRGFATEGAIESLRWGSEELALHRILAMTLPTNTASGRVAARCVLSYKGAARWRGFDWRWYAVDRAEWEEGPLPGA